MEVICNLTEGDVLYRKGRSVVLSFGGKRRVLSTGALNGGLREDLRAVFNHQLMVKSDKSCVLEADTYEKHLALVARRELKLDPTHCTGLGTAARMENMAVASRKWEDFTVTAAVTGGIEVNGGRVGDPAVWHDRGGVASMVPPGTINILLHIDADLAPGVLPRALVTCTEAKTAALQELMASSRYSAGLATGSGTDGTVVICNRESPVELTDAGKHNKLGQYIGEAVMEAVKRALWMQSGLCPQKQHSVSRRLERFGLTREKMEQILGAASDRIDGDSEMVILSSLYAHLLDQLQWGLISCREAEEAAAAIRKRVREHVVCDENIPWEEIPQSRRIAALKDLTDRWEAALSRHGTEEAKRNI